MTTYEDVIKIEVPKSTMSYQPLTNKDLIDNLKVTVDHYGFKLLDERYQLGAKGQQLFGVFTLESNNNEMQKCIGFRNSYNKTLPVGLVAGSNVIVCSNLMFVGDIKKVRKHTINMYDDIQHIMEETVKAINPSFNKIEKDVNHLKDLRVSNELAARLAGEMFIAEELITVTQLSVFKQELLKQGKSSQSGWDIMNHFTEAIKASHPSERMERQILVHERVLTGIQELAY